MPRQGGQGKGKPKLKDRGFGKSIIRKQATAPRNGLTIQEGTNLTSVLDNSALDDFVNTAILADRDVQVMRVHQNDSFLIEPTVNETMQTLSIEHFDFEHLRVPRKPAWNRSMTREEVARNEREAFLLWRREVATMEAATHKRVTPFEKNIEVWRQLWRVVERCDILLQIVDTRNPMLFYSKDLMAYASEQTPPRPMMLLLNKSDFLTEYQRKIWADHLTSQGIKFLFYSAHNEQTKLDEAARAGRAPDVQINDDDVVNLVDDLSRDWLPDSEPTSAVLTDITKLRSRIYSRDELIMILHLLPLKLKLQPKESNLGRVCAGLVGFPNVGKSSVINTILGVTRSSHGVLRVGVSSTPGKTKHFQTLMVNDHLMLCDCPGLVFPSFMNSTGEMICSGILPINQMRDYVAPATVITSRVPMHLLNATYGIHIEKTLDATDNANRPPTASEFLSAYCAVKGYVAPASGRWDEFKACKEVLRDFNDGKLLFVAPPMIQHDGSLVPAVDMDRWLEETEKTVCRNEKIANRLLKLHEKEDELAEGMDELDIDVDEISIDITEESTGKPKREHKKLKYWGKKNRKLRDKNPYDESNGAVAMVAYCTNRNQATEKEKLKRHDPRHAYGTAYTRPNLPHVSVSSTGSVMTASSST